jgi:uncharacterized protein (TIGR00369 family)
MQGGRLVAEDKYLARALRMLDKAPSCNWHDIMIDEASPEKVVARFRVQENNIAPNGFLFAGVILGIADLLCGYGTLCNTPKGEFNFATLEMTTTFVGTATTGKEITFTATPRHIGRTTQVWEAEVTDSTTGKLLTLVRVLQKILLPLKEEL